MNHVKTRSQFTHFNPRGDRESKTGVSSRLRRSQHPLAGAHLELQIFGECAQDECLKSSNARSQNFIVKKESEIAFQSECIEPKVLGPKSKKSHG